MKNIFELLKANKSMPTILSTREAYYYVKAHKLVAKQHFLHYWSERDDQLLKDILDENYPPLEYNHSLEDGYPELFEYYAVAKETFYQAHTRVFNLIKNGDDITDSAIENLSNREIYLYLKATKEAAPEVYLEYFKMHRGTTTGRETVNNFMKTVYACLDQFQDTKTPDLQTYLDIAKEVFNAKPTQTINNI